MSVVNQEQEILSLRKILYVLKKRILLIVLVTCLVTLAGFGYTYLKKPTYTATQEVNYIAYNESGNDMQKNINAMRAYVDTVVDFCDEGIVLETANDIYSDFLKSEKSVDEYVDGFDRENYESLEKSSTRFFEKSLITASAKGNIADDSSSFVFKLSVKAPTVEMARQKSRILVLAIALEAEEAFGGVQTVIDDTVDRASDIPCASNVSKKRITLIAFVIGFALSLLAVYVTEILDRTVQDKDEFEKITDTNLIAYIEKQEGE